MIALLIVFYPVIGFASMFLADSNTDFRMGRDLGRRLPPWLPAQYVLIIFWPVGLVWYWCRWR